MKLNQSSQIASLLCARNHVSVCRCVYFVSTVFENGGFRLFSFNFPYRAWQTRINGCLYTHTDNSSNLYSSLFCLMRPLTRFKPILTVKRKRISVVKTPIGQPLEFSSPCFRLISVFTSCHSCWLRYCVYTHRFPPPSEIKHQGVCCCLSDSIVPLC